MGRTLIIIPAYNEQDALPIALKDLAEHAPLHDVLVVDDGSADRTSQVAAAHGARVIRLSINLGTGGALRTGFRYAMEHGYDRAIQFDGDGQHDASEIERLEAALDAGADMVVGSRFAEETHDYDVGHVRWRAMALLRLLVRLLSGRDFSDTSSGFRGFSRPMLDFFACNYPTEYLSDTVEALLLSCHAGFHVVEIPVAMRTRVAGVASTRNIRLLYHYIRLLVVLMATSPRRNKRLREVAT